MEPLVQPMQGRLYPRPPQGLGRRFVYFYHQTDTKGCPGTAPLMREFWTRVGHGLFVADTTGDDMPAIAVTPQGTVYAYIVRVAAKTVTYGPTEGQRGSIGPKADGTPWAGNALGIYVIVGNGARAYRIGNGSLVLESAVTVTKWERPADPMPTPDPVPVKYPVTVGGKSVGEVELP